MASSSCSLVVLLQNLSGQARNDELQLWRGSDKFLSELFAIFGCLMCELIMNFVALLKVVNG